MDGFRDNEQDKITGKIRTGPVEQRIKGARAGSF